MNLHRDAAQQPDSALREPTHQLAALRGQIESKREELAEIQRVRANLALGEIDRTSISPQLARLRQDGAIEQVDMKWRLSERARQRGVANYLHPQNPKDT